MGLKKFMIGFFALFTIGFALIVSGCQRQTDSQSNGTLSSVEQAQFQKATDQYQVTLIPDTPPLETKAETYVLQVKDAKTGQPVTAETVDVKVIMPMSGGSPMVAPTTVTKGTQPGEYQVKTEFTMAGDWTVQVTPSESAEAISMTVPVQDS
ncbi:MAG: FixH family protein [Cyanobacteria bacterium]|nr:FixH family protein [Cyanobacteriota bacterium]